MVESYQPEISDASEISDDVWLESSIVVKDDVDRHRNPAPGRQPSTVYKYVLCFVYGLITEYILSKKDMMQKCIWDN